MALCPLWMEGLTPEMVEKAEAELGETGERKVEALDRLKQLVNDELGFHPVLDEIFLLSFLRCKKYDTERSFTTLQNYYSYKSKYSGLATDLTPSQVKKVLEIDKFIFSPYRDRDGGVVYYLSWGAFDLSVGSVEEFTAAMLCAIDLVSGLEATQVCGISIIIDYSGMNMRLFSRYFTPSYMRMGTSALQDTLPLRIKGLHIVNEPSYFNVIYNSFVVPFLSKKIKERIYFHGKNYGALHDIFPLECLP